MHANELAVDLALVKLLIEEQFPEFAMLPISKVNSIGTVNYIYRLGDDLYVRLPRVPDWADVEKEWKWLPWISPHISLKIPEPIALGRPNAAYPLRWAIYKWISGSDYSDESICDEKDIAISLASFVNELHSIEVPADAPKAGRLPLIELNKITLEAIDAAKDVLDSEKVVAAWVDSCKASAWHGKPVWIHADLLKTNLLLSSGRLAAVIDFGSAGIGDSAFDLIPAWSVFSSKARGVFLNSVNADKDTVCRARGYALHQAALIIPYYKETNPKFVGMALKTIDEIINNMDVPFDICY